MIFFLVFIYFHPWLVLIHSFCSEQFSESILHECFYCIIYLMSFYLIRCFGFYCIIYCFSHLNSNRISDLCSLLACFCLFCMAFCTLAISINFVRVTSLLMAHVTFAVCVATYNNIYKKLPCWFVVRFNHGDWQLKQFSARYSTFLL